MRPKGLDNPGVCGRWRTVRRLALIGAGFTLGLAVLSTLHFLADRAADHLQRRAASFPGHSVLAGGVYTQSALEESAVVVSPVHLLLVVRGLEVVSLPAGRVLQVAGARAPVAVHLLLDTRIFGEPGQGQTYQIVSRLVATDSERTIWWRVYTGELLSRRALRLQLDRAISDAIMRTRMAERSQLMVERRVSASAPQI